MKNDFGNMLKQWRQRMNLSQLDLANQCDVSPRHLSFLENGKALPSEKMIHKLGDALALSEHDIFLAKKYIGIDSDTEPKEQDDTREVLDRILAKHEPYPALLFDQHLTAECGNNSLIKLLNTLGIDTSKSSCLTDFVFSPEGFFSYVINHEEITLPVLKLVKIKLQTNPEDEQLKHNSEKILKNKALIPLWENEKLLSSPDKAFFPCHLKYQDKVLKWQLVLTSLGTPRIVSRNEHIFILFYPTDSFTEEFAENILKN